MARVRADSTADVIEGQEKGALLAAAVSKLDGWAGVYQTLDKGKAFDDALAVNLCLVSTDLAKDRA